MVSLFKKGSSTILPLYVLLILLKTKLIKNYDHQNELKLIQQSQYCLDDIRKKMDEQITFFANDEGEYLINYSEISNPLKEKISKHNIDTKEAKDEYLSVMLNRIKLFLILAIMHDNDKEKRNEFLKLAFDHYYCMMKNHAYCVGGNNPENLKKGVHANCKNGKFNLILCDVLDNIDSPFNREFDSFLEFTNSDESPLYNFETEEINYDNIKVKKEIQKCNYIKENKEDNLLIPYVYEVENFLYKNI
jgi:hypothetical protein